ncbi:NifU family protein [Halococcoides cellulosivorans]|uniref:NIF system FeS cluster assembly NifU C-terminal domain-containing protein n=1 Tax=Halococcoides cellulosivorans TaxID=1679096 RepID=A0A2R4X2S3_9EURY|nr:NifU family protein [Halococcoides cellulosivorans]AWB28109.1 hypothetical protein HARCEL1_10520 [Halococcoides cellulosivorans]
MSTDTESDQQTLEDRVGNFLRRNFPQIQMHGGNAAVQELDPETGEVTIALGGACSGCGISPMTIQAIKSRMTEEIPEIETVHASTGMDGGMGGMGGPAASRGGDIDTGEAEESADETPDAPF